MRASVLVPFWIRPDFHAQKLVDLPHPLAIALGQVVIDGDDVHTLAGNGVEVTGKRRDERLAFAGLHLGNLTLG